MAERDRSFLWLIIAIWLVAAAANWKVDGLAKRVGQLEVEVRTLRTQ